jgi:hypothetical protein
VGQWYVLLAAASPLLVLAVLQLAGHTAPWHDAGPPLWDWVDNGGWWLFSWLVVVPLVLGVVVRRMGSPPPPQVTTR